MQTVLWEHREIDALGRWYRHKVRVPTINFAHAKTVKERLSAAQPVVKVAPYTVGILICTVEYGAKRDAIRESVRRSTPSYR